MSQLPFDGSDSDTTKLQEARTKFQRQQVNWFVNGESVFRSGTVTDVDMEQDGIKLKIISQEPSDEQGYNPIATKTTLPIERVNLGQAYEVQFKQALSSDGSPIMSGEKTHLKIAVDGKVLENAVTDRNLKRQINTLASAQGLFLTSFVGTPEGYVVKAEPLIITKQNQKLET